MKNNYDFDEREIGATYLNVEASTYINAEIRAMKYEFMTKVFGAILLILLLGIGFGATILLQQPQQPVKIVQPE